MSASILNRSDNLFSGCAFSDCLEDETVFPPSTQTAEQCGDGDVYGYGNCHELFLSCLIIIDILKLFIFVCMCVCVHVIFCNSLIFMPYSLLPLPFSFQNLKNQIMTTNVWVEQVITTISKSFCMPMHFLFHGWQRCGRRAAGNPPLFVQPE